MYNYMKGWPDKANSSVRRGQKAAALAREDGRAAEGGTFGEFGFFLFGSFERLCGKGGGLS